MTLLKFFYIPLLLLLIFSCGKDDDLANQSVSLDVLVTQNTIAQDSVIACASGSLNADEFITYLYPRPGVTDIRYFETRTDTVDENDYTHYQQIDLEKESVFNGYMNKFTRQSAEEKWVIITFMENEVLNLSQAIHIQHRSANTRFTDQIEIDPSEQGSPIFDWTLLANSKDAIYFQVVSDDSDDLLSGTYTFETQFKYYDLDNVVLNVTRETPPDLIPDQTYGFTLMGVSENNWVNTFAQISFTASP
jgi:hypothetical protein